MARSNTRKKHGKKPHRGHGKKTRSSARRRVAPIVPPKAISPVLPPKIKRVQAMVNLSALFHKNNNAHNELANFNGNRTANNRNGNRNGRENPHMIAEENSQETAMNRLAESVRRM
jgi:hypothetical protein